MNPVSSGGQLVFDGQMVNKLLEAMKVQGKPQSLCVEAQTCNSTDNSRLKADSSRNVCVCQSVSVH